MHSTRRPLKPLTYPVKSVFSPLVLVFGLQSSFLTYSKHNQRWAARVNQNMRMYRLRWGKRLAHAHIPVNNQYISTTRCNLIKVFVHHTTEAWKFVCVVVVVMVMGGVLYRNGQYFNCGVLNLVSWVLLVSTSKQEPDKQIKHVILRNTQ